MSKTYTIEDLKNGRVILHNSEEVTEENTEKLKKVLRQAFPEDNSALLGNSEYYYVWEGTDHLWNCGKDVPQVDIPVQKLDLFLQEEQEKFPFTIDCNDAAILLTGFRNTGWYSEILSSYGESLISDGTAKITEYSYNLLCRVAKDNPKAKEALNAVFGTKETIEWHPGKIYEVVTDGNTFYKMAATDYLEFYQSGSSGTIFEVQESQVIKRIN